MNASEDLLASYYDYRTLLQSWIALAQERGAHQHPDDPYAFRIEDLSSLQLLLGAGDPNRPGWAAPRGVHDKWAKVVGAFTLA